MAAIEAAAESCVVESVKGSKSVAERICPERKRSYITYKLQVARSTGLKSDLSLTWRFDVGNRVVSMKSLVWPFQIHLYVSWFLLKKLNTVRLLEQPWKSLLRWPNPKLFWGSNVAQNRQRRCFGEGPAALQLLQVFRFWNTKRLSEHWGFLKVPANETKEKRARTGARTPFFQVKLQRRHRGRRVGRRPRCGLSSRLQFGVWSRCRSFPPRVSSAERNLFCLDVFCRGTGSWRRALHVSAWSRVWKRGAALAAGPSVAVCRWGEAGGSDGWIREKMVPSRRRLGSCSSLLVFWPRLSPRNQLNLLLL